MPLSLPRVRWRTTPTFVAVMSMASAISLLLMPMKYFMETILLSRSGNFSSAQRRKRSPSSETTCCSGVALLSAGSKNSSQVVSFEAVCFL